MNSDQIAKYYEESPSASYFVKKAIKAAAGRDVLDALNDAEALLAFCKLRAQEAGLVTDRDGPIVAEPELLEALKNLYDAVTDERAGENFFHAAQEAARAAIAKAEA